MMKRFVPTCALTVVLLAGGIALGEPNIPSPTLGGKQVWSDVHARGDWRIQKNVITWHYRLLDADDDGIVTVEETRLKGVRDYLLVDAPHGFIDTHAPTLRGVVSFLNTGRFNHAPQ